MFESVHPSLEKMAIGDVLLIKFVNRIACRRYRLVRKRLHRPQFYTFNLYNPLNKSTIHFHLIKIIHLSYITQYYLYLLQARTLHQCDQTFSYEVRLRDRVIVHGNLASAVSKLHMDLALASAARSFSVPNPCPGLRFHRVLIHAC